jgi:membrane fusion protein, peptide pheromone/bacteriocin exporter
MKRVMVLQHQNDMMYSREFFLLEIPEEINVLFYTVCVLFTVAAGIVTFGRIDDVVKVSGIVRTKENVSSVKNVIAGKIIEIDYKPGQKVCRGDILYKIDPSIYNAQRESLTAEQKDLKIKQEGIQSLITSYARNKNMVSRKNPAAYTRFKSYLKQKQELLVKLQIAEQLYKDEINNPPVLKNMKNIEAGKKEYELAQAELDSCKADFIAKLYSENDSLDLAYKTNTQNLAKIDNQYLFLLIRSPVDGYVQEISSLNTGDYIEADKSVLNIVPNDKKSFRVEIQIPPKDMGKIKSGMKVKYRLSAFPYFEYQGAEGKITAVDPDIRSGSSNSLYYSVYADIDRIEFSNRHGNSFPIRAGLETNVRIVLETNTILYFILKKMDFLY